MVASHPLSRRKALKLGAAAAALPLVHIRTAGAAGKVSIGFWDHWVPAGNDVMKKQVAAWADKNKVDVQVDFITSVGNKNLLTIAAEAQAKPGHDVLAFPTWEVLNNADNAGADGRRDEAADRRSTDRSTTSCEYLGEVPRATGWRSRPARAPRYKGPCGRISVLQATRPGIDVVDDVSRQGRAATRRGDDWT